MLVNNTYEVSIKIENQDFDFSPQNISFNLRDSIYNFYPVASMTINDAKALYNEYLAFVNGTKIDITYGLETDYTNCTYNVIKNSIPDQFAANGFGGLTNLSLIHNYFFNQSKISKAYKDEISSIVKKCINNFTFSKTFIERTLNKGSWYQPLVNNSEFITQYLLPFCYSPTSKNTPFFSFINSNNEFYFESYYVLMNQGIVEELEFSPKGIDTSLALNSIHSLYTYQTPLSEIRDSINQLIYSFDKTATIQTTNELLADFLNQNRVAPIIADENLKYYYDVYSDDIKDDNIKNNNRGLKLFNKRNIFTVDKIIILTNLNRKLCAGKKIKVNVPVYSEKEQKELSPRYSGEYIIESSYHAWDSKKGCTIVVASRQAINVPNTYRQKKLLVGN